MFKCTSLQIFNYFILSNEFFKFYNYFSIIICLTKFLTIYNNIERFPILCLFFVSILPLIIILKINYCIISLSLTFFKISFILTVF